MKDGNANHGSAELLPAATSELNNLIQIIAGTVKLLENIWEGDSRATKYFEMLSMSTDRATKVMSQLVEEAGGSERKILLHPSFAGPLSAGPAKRPPKAQRIMVVDDEPMALVLSKHVLTQAGFEVLTAQSGVECLDLYRSRQADIDLVLLDLTMPLMDGEETFRRLRTIDPHATVVLNTGFISEDRLERMMADGLAGFVRRPYQPAEVVAQIRSVLAVTSGDGSGGSPPIPF
ncbi:MAG: response regulator [Chthoniobacterales bacterium]